MHGQLAASPPAEYMAGNQNYISLYVPCGEGAEPIPERYQAALPKAKIGQGCVRFKRLCDLDRTALEKTIREGVHAAAKASGDACL